MGNTESQLELKVALIASPYPLSEAPSPPLGLSYAASACIEAGAQVTVFDYIVSCYTPRKLQYELDSFKPDVVGTNSVTMNFHTAARIIRDAKRHNPALITIMGGPHVSFDIEGTFRNYPELDLIVLGEGEETLKELLPIIKKRELWSQVKGIAYQDEGEIVTTDPRPFIRDLDSLPLPARHLLPLSRYQALGYPVSIITSRGCPNRCIFCLGHRMVGHKVRHRSPEKVADEIEHILSYGIDRINVADDTFTANRERVRTLCREISKRGLAFGWSAFSRVNTVDAETLHMMREAGCDSISFGIESGNTEMLKLVRKGITLEQARRAVRYCKEAGIEPHASFIIGLPGETPETLRDTHEFAEELGIEYGYHMLAPFPGTTVREEIDQYDLEILTDNWDLYDANRAIVRTSGMTESEMNQFLVDFEEKRLKRWAAVQDRYYRNLCTPDEAIRVEGWNRMNIVFDLLSQDIIEEAGSFSVDGRDPVSELVRRVSSRINREEQFVKKAIDTLVTSGYLNFDQNGERIDWYWTHNNHVDKP